jgi:hypothetical protein
MSKPWPPPPDLESLKELFATADVEDLIADEAPTDEYDPEAKHFFTAIDGYTTQQLTVTHTLPILEQMWVKQFTLSEEQLDQRRPALLALAQQIERFFGPSAQPQVR